MKRLVLSILLISGVACRNDRGDHFASIVDAESLTITLDRSECWGGQCPSYIVEIRGDGTVNFCGEAFVEQRGVRTKTIPQRDVQILFNAILDANFFELKDRYVTDFTDGATFQIKVDFDGKSKLVVDYFGEWLEMPEAVTELQNSIDKTAGTENWIGEVSEYDRFTDEPICSNRLQVQDW